MPAPVLPPREPDETWRFGPYLVTHHHVHPTRLVIVFASAGQDGLGEPLEEFRGSLLRHGVSMAFVIDRNPRWLNHAETADALAHTAALAARYPDVGVLGESMGGSGAILFAGLCPHARRILALTPQYSVARPFIAFDSRFSPFADAYPDQQHWSFTAAHARARIHILFGTTEWLDTVHAGMYLAEGYHVRFIDGAGHLVGQHLKRGTPDNRLAPLLGAFTDFDASFDSAAIDAAIGPLAAPSGSTPRDSFFAFKNWNRTFHAAARAPRKLPPPPGLVDLAQGRPADQSSVSPWSRAPTTTADAAGAVSGEVSASYAFHTDIEDRPWWRVDLGRTATLRELRLYNRLEHPHVADRGLQFAVEYSLDDTCTPRTWIEAWRKADRRRFGGADGHPLRWNPPAGLSLRHLRLRLLGRDFQHFAAVELFCDPPSEAQR